MNDGANARKPAGKFRAGFETRFKASTRAASSVTSSAAQVLIELVEAPGPDDRRRHARPCLHPGESDGGRRRVDFASDPDQLVDDGVISFGQRGRHSLASSGGHGRRVLAGVLSSQHGAGKGRPRRHADAELTG
jgi:hypothetical protein